MSDTNIDPLAMPAGEVPEPSFPTLVEGVKRMIIRGFEVVSSTKEGKEQQRLSIKLETTVADKDTDGNIMNPGFAFLAPVFLTPNERNTAKQIGEQAAMPVKAALGTKTKTTVRQCIDNPALILNKIVDVKVGIRKGKDEYEGQFSNVVKNWIVPAPTAG